MTNPNMIDIDGINIGIGIYFSKHLILVILCLLEHRYLSHTPIFIFASLGFTFQVGFKESRYASKQN